MIVNSIVSILICTFVWGTLCKKLTKYRGNAWGTAMNAVTCDISLGLIMIVTGAPSSAKALFAIVTMTAIMMVIHPLIAFGAFINSRSQIRK